MDENILVKMFEIRINNLRQFLFSYLILIVTFTLAISSNERIYNYFNSIIIIGFSEAKIIIALGVIGILLMVYQTFGVDRLTLKELEYLFKAKEKLNQLKKEGGGEPKQQLEITGTPPQIAESTLSRGGNIAQIEFIKAGLDFLKLLTSATLAAMFLIVIYNLQTLGTNLINVNFSLSILGFVLITEFVVYVGVMYKLKDPS